MADQFVIGSVFASVVGFILIYSFFVVKSVRKVLPADAGNSNGKSLSVTTRTICINGECRSETDADVIIVGAGVAGAALAHTLGKDGRRVRVIERDLTEPDRIVGELLQPGGYLKLMELGLEDCVEEIDAQRVFGYALFKDGKNTRLSYPLEKFHADVAGRSFHNGRFIQRMREKASLLPNVQLQQGTVLSLLEDNGTIKGVMYKTKTGEVMKAYAPLTIVCDGCFSNLRGSLCNPQVDVPSCFVGLILEKCQLPYENHGHVVLADPSPILFYRISSTEIRCLVDVPGQKVPSISNGDLSKYLKTVVAPQPVASTINTLAGALYKVFCASADEARQEMREACFDYLSLGGVFSNGPVSLLSGLNPRPLSLVVHFFAVAIYGVGRLLLPFPSPKRMWMGAQLISGASGIIFPIIKAEGVRQMFFPATVPAYHRAPKTTGSNH
ncbi:Aromatic-ring hydroxylase-like protein [Cynara cardunculus var. scolymus]|uniref:Squalene monooxygenase n=1 Tax=Cynara cardunculus var. scolymus TaxID=59895 RepID=A0A118K6N1_CYNCS|nr:Aromatic-ring hydroxylase-like protein [Cynara cardunculus var. scolymus]